MFINYRASPDNLATGRILARQQSIISVIILLMNDLSKETTSTTDLEIDDRITRQFKDIYESDQIKEALRDHFLGNIDDYAREIFAKSGGITIKRGGFDYVFYPVNPLSGSYHVTRYVPDQRIKGAIDITASKIFVRGYEILDAVNTRKYFTGKVGVEKAQEILLPFNSPQQ